MCNKNINDEIQQRRDDSEFMERLRERHESESELFNYYDIAESTISKHSYLPSDGEQRQLLSAIAVIALDEAWNEREMTTSDLVRTVYDSLAGMNLMQDRDHA